MRETVIQPLGLLTRPNQYGQFPPGACSKAQNVVFRAPGIVEGFNDVATGLNNITLTGYSIKKIFSDGWATGDQILTVAFKNAVIWKLTSGLQNITGLANAIDFTTGFVNGVYVRDRWVIGGLYNPFVLDSASDTTVRFAGFESPQIFEKQSTTTVAAAALPNQSACTWRCHFKRVTGSYIITGAVSNAFSWVNTSGSTVDVTLKIAWPNNGILLAGDTIELYRTPAQPVGTDTGDDEFLSISYILTASDIASHYALIRDSTIDTALGASLYTNTDQLGLIRSFQIPPTSTDLANFKGYTFYVATAVANSIFVRVPGLWGSLSSAAEVQFGIGDRTKTGCTTNIGSPIILVPDTTGLDVGQRVSHADFLAGTLIISIVANVSVTVDHNASASHGGATVFFEDRLEVTGIMTVASSLLNVIGSLSGNTLITVDQILQDSSAGSANLQGASIRLSIPYAANALFPYTTIRGTNPQNYSPPIPGISATAQSGTSDPRNNRLIFSELDQPEACPEVNEVLIGRGIIYRIIPTRDALWCFCSDGLWRLSGEGGIWRVDPVDLTLVLAAPNAVDVLRDKIFAYTNRGVVEISDSGILEITRGVVEDLIPGASYVASFDTFLTADQARREIWLTFRAGGTSTSYIYNTEQQAWSTYVGPSGGGADYLSATAYDATYTSLVYGTHEVGLPRLIKFLATTARRNNSVLQFQPLMGDVDPVTLKQFIDLTCVMSNLATTESITPYWDGLSNNARSLKLVNAGSGLASEWRATFGIPRNNQVNVSLRPGLSFDITTQPWIIRGFSVRWTPAAEESLR